MNLFETLKDMASTPGVSGYEDRVARVIAEAFEGVGDRVEIDRMHNVIVAKGNKGPRIMVTAHQDEIGLMVRDIEKDGCLRVTNVGGLPARVLPASEVIVHAAGGDLFGVVGAKPPHLLSEEDRKQAVQMKDVYIDIGFDEEKARALVRIGDVVTMKADLMQLQGSRVTGKAMDDRCAVISMLVAAEELSRYHCDAQVAFVSAAQEEPGCRMAHAAAFTLEPDLAIVVDVTHAETPGTTAFETVPLNKIAIAVGPNMHPAMSKRLMRVADKNHIGYTVEPCGHATATDARAIQITGTGIATLLIGIPLKYMHSSVELIDMDVVEEVGRLIALFIEDVARDWEDIKWN